MEWEAGRMSMDTQAETQRLIAGAEVIPEADA
jgi:hypothetical protein